ncbi:MAG: hypothetical protein GY867_01895 [bacterium]|nr:hypothetical protein [bacterium]
MLRLPVIHILLVFIVLTSGGSTSRADSTPGNIHPRIRVSFSERFRLVSWDNAIHLEDAAEGAATFTRHRTSLMGQWFATERVELALKVTNEFRYHFVPQDREFSFDEIFIDQLYVKWATGKFLPGTLTLGRQNIILGEGFVVMDGHPLDGSRSIYHNAARFDWKVAENSRLTLFCTYQPEFDETLPIIHESDQQLIEQPEMGIGAYYHWRHNDLDLQAYFIRKNVQPGEMRRVKSRINTLGVRGQHPLTTKLSITGEGACQFGDYGEVDRSAFGGYAHADYKADLKGPLPKKITLGALYLSGDDPGTEDNENWDPLFSRWPKWSESYIYTQVREDGVAYWTNCASLYGRVEFDVAQGVALGLDYHHLMAPEHADASVPFPGGAGRNRGDLVIGMLKYRVNQQLTGHILWESFTPGSYYFSQANGYAWARVEFLLKL